jgi:hypothetical protein
MVHQNRSLLTKDNTRNIKSKLYYAKELTKRGILNPEGGQDKF